MVGTWKVLERRKGGGVGSPIPWSAGVRKGLGELRTCPRQLISTLGNDFFFAPLLFRNFPKEPLRIYRLSKRNLLCSHI